MTSSLRLSEPCAHSHVRLRLGQVDELDQIRLSEFDGVTINAAAVMELSAVFGQEEKCTELGPYGTQL